MLTGWLDLVKWLTSQFGLPGSIAVCIALYAFWLLQLERQSHEKTRDKVDDINEKRVEFTKATLQAQLELNTALQAVSALLGKNK